MARLLPVAVALVTALTFTPALWTGFVWDDEAMFLQNPSYRGLGWTELAWMFTTVHMTHYTPLSWLTLGLDHVLWGMRPSGYHATNVILHAVTAVLVSLCAARLLGMAMAGAPGPRTATVREGAALAGLLFAVHPLRVESVVWVTERRDVLCGLFYVAAVLAYLRTNSPDAARPARPPALHWCLLLFSLALLSKSMAVTLPLVLLILDVYPLRRLGGNVGWWGGAARRVWWEKAPFLLLSAAVGIVQIAALFASGNAATVVRPGALGRIAIAVFGLALYLLKTVLPVRLSPLYALDPERSFLAWPFLASGAFVVGMTVLAVAVRRRWPALLPVWLSYVVILLPVLGTANTFQIAADRYSYLAALGWAVLAGLLLAGRGRSDPDAAPHDALQERIAKSGLALAAIAGLIILTVLQIGVWRDAETLWTHALEVDPASPVAHYNLGVIRMGQGLLGDAEEHFTETVTFRPRHVEGHNNRGLALLWMGRPREALTPLREAVRRKPDFAYAHNNLGLAYLRVGDRASAESQFRKALAIAPDLTSAHANLGALLLSTGRAAEALAHFDRAAALDPSLAGLAEARAEAQAAMAAGRK
ncbi:MAG TPA: tetratricopeptide repeat protein [Candidatus Limnocylindrales bacterium]|nr:tetratricopeptide repeat protein [Candidatus Limnocylindrales bacterium]